VVRVLNRAVLEEAGYTVIGTSDGGEALEVFKERGSCVDMLVTDVIMPNLDGKRLYEEISAIRSDMKVIFMSGYSEEYLHARGIVDDGINFMPKPVLSSELLKNSGNYLTAREEAVNGMKTDQCRLSGSCLNRPVDAVPPQCPLAPHRYGSDSRLMARGECMKSLFVNKRV